MIPLVTNTTYRLPSWEPNSLLSGRMRQPKRANKLHTLRFIASRGSCRSTPSCLQPPALLASQRPTTPPPPFSLKRPSSSFLDPPITFLHSKFVRCSVVHRHPRLDIQQVTSNINVLQSSVLPELKVTLKLMERSFLQPWPLWWITLHQTKHRRTCAQNAEKRALERSPNTSSSLEKCTLATNRAKHH